MNNSVTRSRGFVTQKIADKLRALDCNVETMDFVPFVVGLVKVLGQCGDLGKPRLHKGVEVIAAA